MRLSMTRCEKAVEVCTVVYTRSQLMSFRANLG